MSKAASKFIWFKRLNESRCIVMRWVRMESSEEDVNAGRAAPLIDRHIKYFDAHTGELLGVTHEAF